MSQPVPFLNNEQLIDVLSSTKHATAIHITGAAVIQTANDAMLRIWGKDKSVIGKSLEEGLPELKGQPFLDLFKKVWNEGLTISGTDTPADLLIDGKLQTFYFDFEYRAVKDDSGKTICILHTATDVTDRYFARLKEQALAEELSAANEELSAANEELNENNQELAALNEELRVTAEELTESQQQLIATNEKAVQAEEMVSLAVDAARIGSWHIDPVTKALKYNATLAEIFGYENIEPMTYDQAIGQVTENYRSKILKEIEVAISQGGNYDITYSQHRFNDGELIWLRSKGRITKDKSGNYTVFAGVVTDITEQVQSREAILGLNEELATTNEELASANEEQMATNEELVSTVDELRLSRQSLEISQLELMESEEALKFAINAAELGTFDLNPATRRFKGNNRLKAWFGLEPKEEIELLKATDVIADKDRDKVLAAIDEAMTYSSGGHYYVDYTIINPIDKIPRHVLAKGQALFNANHEPTRFSGTLEDITEQEKARKELERMYEQARLSKETAELGIFDMDLVENTLEWDTRCRTLFGISHNNTISYEDDFIPGLHEDDRDRVIGIINNVFIKAISNGDYDVEYRTVGAEDGKLRWVRAKGKTLFNERDEPVRFIGSVIDITEQKLDEQRKNDFIGMVSHELKTPLTSLSAYVQLLLTKAVKGEDKFSGDVLSKANQQVKKMTTMINGFLNVSRLESAKILVLKQDFDINELLLEIADETRLMAAGYAIVFDNHDQIKVHADRDKIASVISNLLSNAIKYSPKGSTVEINCKITGKSIRVSVKDEGLGIKSQDTKKLFERYYRVQSPTTQHISGFGIGLYLSAEIIHRHNGQIGVESEYGTGSTFWFTLPLA